jgi:protocatechuate 3,4-dioxygenase beta subunit
MKTIYVTLFLTFAFRICGASAGSLHGTVLDTTGNPVIAATVEIVSADDTSTSGVPYVLTDKNGTFEVHDLRFGEYRVFAFKESDDFPNTYFSFYSNNRFVRVVITQEKPITSLTVQIAKGARIVGTVVDKSNGKPVSATFQLSRLDKRTLSVSTRLRPSFSFLLPTDTAVSLKVTAGGFEP